MATSGSDRFGARLVTDGSGRAGADVVARLVTMARPGAPRWTTIDAPHDGVRAYAVRTTFEDLPFTIVVLRTLEAEAETLEAFREVVLVAIPHARSSRPGLASRRNRYILLFS